MTIEMTPIGFVTSLDFTDKGGFDGNISENSAVLHILPQFKEGLCGLKAGQSIEVLFHFSLSKGYSLTVFSQKHKIETGVFNTHSPNRPNGIGRTVCRIISIDGCDIAVKGSDMFEGTPILDIKPFDK